MYGSRSTSVWITGLQTFLNAAEANRSAKGFMCCPCKWCENKREYSKITTLHSHIASRGFMPNYSLWTEHGEPGVVMEEGEEEEEIPEWVNVHEANSAYEEEPMDEAVADDDIALDDELGQVLIESREKSVTELEHRKFQKMIEDHKKLLYPGCKEEHKKLHTTLDMLQWKATNGVSDKGFDELLRMIKDMLPADNELPASTYAAKKVVCPLGLEVQKIHACPNDCILYRGEKYENLESCPICKALRYKIRRDDPGDVEGEEPSKKIAAKVMWYFPIIPRLKRLFRSKENAKLMRWHKERKQDNFLRHPADGSQWRNIDREFKDFAEEERNIRFALSADGMNPFGNQSTSHSTWPVTLSILNLPPWMCLKRKFIMMPLLIPGPNQTGNDIDVYLRPLIDDLLLLWRKEGVTVWDEDQQADFQLRALLFVTINDWPALSNLSGQSNKGYRACTHCLDDTDSVYLKYCKKNVYMGHRRFLPPNHPLRKDGKHFKGEQELRLKPVHCGGKRVHSMLQGVEVIHGKGPGSKPAPKDDNGRAPMWKKKSIFWELPYWEFLDVRHAIDVMHVMKCVCVNLLGFLGVHGKGRDTLQARQDLKHMGQREDLHPEKRDNGQHWLRPASYTLSKEEKKSMFDCLKSIKVPSGYSSNVKGII